MDAKTYLKEVRTLISQNRLPEAMTQLRELLAHSPQLNEVLLQSARHADITKQINRGSLSHADSQLTLNQIRSALLDLTSEVDEQLIQGPIQREVAEAISVMHSKNVLIGSTISAGGNIQIGDNTTYTETKTSRNLKIWVFLLIPLLVAGAAYLWYQNIYLSQPLTLKVRIENQTPNPNLPAPSGTLSLIYGGVATTQQNVAQGHLFEQIPATYRDQHIRLTYTAQGFTPIDTTISYTEAITLPASRNDDLAIIQGYIYTEDPQRDTPIGIPGVKVSTACCDTTTDATGKFRLRIPPIHQRKQQRLDLTHPGFHPKSITEPIIKGAPIRTYLDPK